jgi:hypothetical protein
VFDRIMQMTDNAGATDEHRALNYLTVRYPAIYAAVAQAQGRNCSLTAVDLRPSTLSGVRNIVEVIFSFTDRATDVVEKQFLRVDVSRGTHHQSMEFDAACGRDGLAPEDRSRPRSCG